jgi:hypothetical protein
MMLSSILATKLDASAQKQNAEGFVPNRAKPQRLSASVNERYTVSMIRQTLNPFTDLISVERRVEPHHSKPRL